MTQPKLRFAQFDGDWNTQKLEHLASFSKGNGYSKSDLVEFGNPIILYGSLYTDYQTAIHTIKTFVKQKEKSVISTGNEVIIPASGETAQDIARASAVINPNIILGGDLNIIKPNKQINNIFLALTLSCGRLQKELSAKAQGKSVVHLRNNDLKKLDIFYPTLTEQTTIGNFFRQVDKLIALHQGQLDKVKTLKKGLLQKMFPAQGETVPQIRFPQFTDAWECQKLGEVVEIVGGGTPDTKNLDYWDGEIDWYSPTEIGDQIYAKGSIKKITELGLQKSSAKVLPANRTILFTSRASIGDTAILLKSGTTNQGFQSFIVDYKKSDIYFLYTIGSQIKKFALKNATGSTFLEISKNQLSKMPIMLPSIKEQTTIGNFFRQFDDLINLHQRKLEHLKALKKSLLQQMFV